MTLPIFSGEEIVAVVGVANKDSDYDDTDVIQLRMCMDAVWKVVARKQSEDVQAQLSHDLAVKNEELESLLYAASHDLRSPLINIEGFSRRLEKACRELGELLQHPALPADVHLQANKLIEQQIATALRYSHAGVAKMNSLLRGLLQLSRLGRVVPKLERVDMDQLLQQNLDALRYQLQKAGAQITRDPLPPCLADAAYLGQVFGNLLDNAVKYRDPDRPLEISISGQVVNREAVYCVADTGIGIAPDHVDKIWELFHRLQPDGPVPGEGLGLNFVQRILIQQHGRVWVESVPGHGSRFFVALPVASGPATPQTSG
jgi:signal transduction histidine kinase